MAGPDPAIQSLLGAYSGWPARGPAMRGRYVGVHFNSSCSNGSDLLSPVTIHCPRTERPAKRTASSAALNRALALFTHSVCSLSGTLSATTPAPAWTYILPSLTIAVLSTMQVSMSPLEEK